MRRLLTSTAALSIALAPVQPWPLVAQTLTEEGLILAEDGTILCEPTAEAPCLIENYGPEGLLAPEALAPAEETEAVGEVDAPVEAEAAEAEAATAAEAEAQAAAEAEAAAAAEAEAQAAAEAEAAAAAEAEAQAAAEAEAAATAEAEAQAAAEAEAAAAEAEAQAATEAEAAAAAEAEAQAAAEAEAAETQAAEPEAADAEPVIEPALEPVADAPTEAPSAEETSDAVETAEEVLIEEPTGEFVDPAAGLKAEVVEVDPNAVPVEAPIVTETEIETLGELLATPDVLDPGALEAAATLVPEAASASEEPASDAAPELLPLA